MTSLTVRSIALVALVSLALPAVAADREDVEATIERAYIEGVHRQSDGDLVRTGFHESFTLYVLLDGELTLIGRDEWIGHIESLQAKQAALEHETTWRLTQLDITGDVASARVEVDQDGNLRFTAYLSLYRFEDGWKIVAKVVASHS